MLSSVINNITLDPAEISKIAGLSQNLGLVGLTAYLNTINAVIDKSMKNPLQVQKLPSVLIDTKEIKELYKEYSDKIHINLKDVLKVRKICTGTYFSKQGKRVVNSERELWVFI